MFKDLQMISLVINGTEISMRVPEFMALLSRGVINDASSCKDGMSCMNMPYRTMDFASTEMVDTIWMLFSGLLVLVMQAGFVFFELGSSRVSTTNYILTKSLIDWCVVALGSYLFTFTLAWMGGDRFVGYDGGGYALHNIDTDLLQLGQTSPKSVRGFANAFWFYQAALNIIVPSIISGATAERVEYHANIIYAFILCVFVTPVMQHWAWSSTGWASPFNIESKILGVGVIDYAGSATIHVVGGMAALIACKAVGPRLRRFENQESENGLKRSSPQAVALHSIGTVLMWIGFYGVIGGSTKSLSGEGSMIVIKSIVNASLGAVISGSSLFVIESLLGNSDDALQLGNMGFLAGFVGISSSCALVEPEAAIIIGFISSLVFMSSRRVIVYFKIDDAVDAISIHLSCGIWGTLAAAIFSTRTNYKSVYGNFNGVESCGLLYSCDNSVNQLGANVIYLLATIAWTSLFSLIIFYPLQTFGVLRVANETELDQAQNIMGENNSLDLYETQDARQSEDLFQGSGAFYRTYHTNRDNTSKHNFSMHSSAR